MTGWKRTPEHLAKTRDMSDGMLLHLLVDRGVLSPNEFDNRIYQELVALQDQWRRNLAFGYIAGAIAILAYMEVLTSISASGISVSPVGFKHVAITLMGIVSLTSALTSSKLSY